MVLETISCLAPTPSYNPIRQRRFYFLRIKAETQPCGFAFFALLELYSYSCHNGRNCTYTFRGLSSLSLLPLNLQFPLVWNRHFRCIACASILTLHYVIWSHLSDSNRGHPTYKVGTLITWVKVAHWRYLSAIISPLVVIIILYRNMHFFYPRQWWTPTVCYHHKLCYESPSKYYAQNIPWHSARDFAVLLLPSPVQSPPVRNAGTDVCY